MNEEALFTSAHSALVFAFNFSGQQYDRPMMNRIASPAIGSGKGLAGLDGAAQAGMIKAELRALGLIYEAVLIARIAPKWTPCDCGAPCCGGRKTNGEWFDAIGTLTAYAKDALQGCFSHYNMRNAIVQKYFGVNISLADIADACDVNRDTASSHNARVLKVLKADESKAWAAIDGRLIAAGMVVEAKTA